MNRRPLGCLVEIAETLVLTLIIFLVIQAFVAQPFQVMQESMRMTLEEGQYVLVDKLTPNFDDYSRGDIVVFHPPSDVECPAAECPPSGEGEQRIPFIKRVIGEPGDNIEIHDGAVFVNEVQLDEPYVFSGATRAPGANSSWVVPEDSLFVMGDNRNNSTDSRSFQYVPHENVIGRAVLRYWPLSALGILQTPTYENVPPGNASVEEPGTR